MKDVINQIARKRFFLLFFPGIFSLSVNAQQVHLTKLLEAGTITEINRAVNMFGSDSDALQMDAREGDGLAVLEDLSFKEGTIELEILGENNPGKSFVGLAFNIQNDSTYEVIYFRPFNFVAEEPLRKVHMVQYIYHPEFSWRKLRTERKGEFENEIPNPPDPDQWFKAQISISANIVKVYVNGQDSPCLMVPRLATASSSRIGLWTGFNSSGRFRMLKLSKN